MHFCIQKMSYTLLIFSYLYVACREIAKLGVRHKKLVELPISRLAKFRPLTINRKTINCQPPWQKLVLDLHDIYNQGQKIDQALNNIIDEAVETPYKTGRNHSGKRGRTTKKESDSISKSKTHQGEISSPRQG